MEEAKKSLIIREVLGGYPSDSEVIGFLIRHGAIRVSQLEAQELERLADKGVVVR